MSWASVIVPAYNAARTIEICLGALLAQTSPHEWYEIVVDGSGDGTTELAEKPRNVRVMRTFHRGPAAAGIAAHGRRAAYWWEVFLANRGLTNSTPPPRSSTRSFPLAWQSKVVL